MKEWESQNLISLLRLKLRVQAIKELISVWCVQGPGNTHPRFLPWAESREVKSSAQQAGVGHTACPKTEDGPSCSPLGRLLFSLPSLLHCWTWRWGGKFFYSLPPLDHTFSISLHTQLWMNLCAQLNSPTSPHSLTVVSWYNLDHSTSFHEDITFGSLPFPHHSFFTLGNSNRQVEDSLLSLL